ncbi:exported hypothetical protein [Candidatus Contendobacter odensis Run_B_J11]|uniref:DUF2845 domain-containing protein n=2 Tax=Candidatus Contendibacter odensensis TaxID=1400860 RepID=A0A7U7J5S1_9GAMM|nr:exported hypothetical protein [Candidatus Contendobacter odensis Run_B_J11]
MRGFGWLVLVCALAVGATSAVADSIRCGGYLVNTGDSQSRVLQICGEPQRAWQDGFIEQVVRRNEGYAVNPAPLNPDVRPPGYETEYRRVIPVYRWDYSFGPGTFLKTLIFHGDVLVNILDGPRQ